MCRMPDGGCSDADGLNIKESGSVHTITYLTNISFGLGASDSLPEILREVGVSRPLLISDHGVKSAGLLERPGFDFLKTAPTFLDVPSNPTESAVAAGPVLWYRMTGRAHLMLAPT